MNSRKMRMVALVLAAGMSGAAQATLHDRGGGLIYDDVLNVTWLQDANYAKTSGYDADGKMNWTATNTWAANLSYYDSVRNVTYSDWRLPTMVDTTSSGCDYANVGTDCGYNVQTVSGSTVYSEMAHMYYTNLGLKGYVSPNFFGVYQADFGIFGNGTSDGVTKTPYGHSNPPYGQNDVGLIDNLQANYYWSGLRYSQEASSAWTFFMYDGYQSPRVEGLEHYAWAVRPGDVAAVPEVETYALMLAGLGLVGAMARRRKIAKV